EVGGVEEVQGDGVEGVALLGALDSGAGQLGPDQPGVQDGVAAVLEPLFQQRDLGGASASVGPLDDDEAARKLGVVDPRGTVPVEADLGHGPPTPGCAARYRPPAPASASASWTLPPSS